MAYTTLIDLWPKPDYRDYPETVEQERARLKAGGDWIELVERTDYQRVIRYKELGYIRVQGTLDDWALTVQAPCGLSDSIAALKQIAFYAVEGARIPEGLAHHFAQAVDAMALSYREDVNAVVDDAAISQKCLNILGRKLGILAGHRRPAVSFHMVGYFYNRFYDELWEENRKEVVIMEKEGKLPAAEISYLEDVALVDAMSAAKAGVKEIFNLSDQQVERFLEKYEQWKDGGEDPRDMSFDE